MNWSELMWSASQVRTWSPERVSPPLPSPPSAVVIAITLLQLGHQALCVVSVGNGEEEEILLGSAGGIMTRIALSSIRVLKGKASKGCSVMRLQAHHLPHSSLYSADVDPNPSIMGMSEATDSDVYGENWLD